jgi:hypothetical protein
VLTAAPPPGPRLAFEGTPRTARAGGRRLPQPAWGAPLADGGGVDLRKSWTRELLPEYIRLLGERRHAKASERYIDVVFNYPDSGETWEGSVPIEYRRTGIHAQTPEETAEIILAVYEAMKLANREKWLREQERFWSIPEFHLKTTLFSFLVWN